MLLEDILYYKKTISAPIYSNIPGPYISPEKIIEGVPPFLSYDNSSILTPKTLLIPKLDFSKNPRAGATLVCRLRKLKEAGHSIVAIKNNLPIDLEINFVDQFIYLDPVPSLKICSSLFNTPADELLLCDEAIIQLLINGDISDLKEFKTFKNILLKEHPLSQELFEQLLREHGESIETLEIEDCPNITDLMGDVLTNLISLSVIPFNKFMVGEMISNVREVIRKNALRLKTLILNMHCIDKEIINDIPALTNLTTLSLTNCKTFSADIFKNSSLNEIEALDLRCSNITTASLYDLLQGSPKVKNINLSWCKSLREEMHNSICLDKLENLNLSESSITTPSLQALLQGAVTIKSLNLSSCRNLKDTFNDLLLSELEELNLSGSTINSASLQALLRGTFKLKLLDLCNCENLTDDIFNPISLGELEDLDLRYSAISMISLQALLQNSPKLKSLVLSNCRTLGDYTLHDISLSELEELDIKGSTINIASLQTILQGTPKLKTLRLSRYKNFSQHVLKGISLGELEKLSLKLSTINIASLQILLQGAFALKTLNLSRCRNLQDDVV